MKLRFSSTLRKDEVTFRAENEQEFIEQAILAAREFRERHYRKVHRGEIGKNLLWFDSATAGMWDESHRQWYNPGKIGSIESGLQFFESYTYELSWAEAETLDQMFAHDEFELRANGAQLWQGFCASFRWGLALGNLTDEIAQSLEND